MADLEHLIHQLRKNITAAISDEKIAGVHFVRLNQWQWVMQKLAESFLARGVLDLESVWLWEHVKKPYTSYPPDDALLTLRLVLQPTQAHWFIASDEDGKYWVLEATGDAVLKLLSEMYPFEYYLMDKEMTWLLCENHHGLMIAKGAIESKLKAIPEAFSR